MKTRLDFVSNSSSSSYVLSVNMKAFEGGAMEFVNLVCGKCFFDGKERQKERGLDERNMSSFLYGILHTQLLYLGEFTIGRKTETVRRDGDDTWFFEQCMEDWKSDRMDGTDEEHTKALSVTDDEIVYEHDVMAPRGGFTVLNDYMENFIRRRKWTPKGMARHSAKDVAGKILSLVEACRKIELDYYTGFKSDTYRITKETVANTRDMIKAGYEASFEKWEDLDAIEARLDAGETVFGITVSDSGDGEGDTKLFSMDSRYPFEGLPVECLTADG